MNKWMEPFISQCLAGVPWGRYRRRTEKELRDHMEELRQDLTEAEVLRVMGDPERLRKEYHIAWKQPPLCRVGWIVIGVIATWCLIFLSMSLAVLFPFSGGLLSHGLASGILLFLIPFPLGALFLRACFREERRRAWWVTLVLLLSWASFNRFLIVVNIAFEEIDQYWERTVWMSVLLERMPWLTAYLWSSFLGCLALGWLFGHQNERRRELA